MNIFSKIADRAEAMVRPDDFHGLQFIVNENLTGREDIRWPSRGEFRLTLELSVSYWANHAERPVASKIARQKIAHILFADVHASLYELRSAIADGDRRAAFVACDKLQDAITP